MKMIHWGRNCGQRLVLSLAVLILICAAKVFAQSPVPVVTIEATDPIAATYQTTNLNPYVPFMPLGKFGVFTVFRHGDQSSALNIYYQIGGTASNGVDYFPISNWVTIPAGATSNLIRILPLANRPSPSITKTVI